MSGNIIPVKFRPARVATPAQLSLEQNTQLQQIARKLVIGPVLSIDDYRFLQGPITNILNSPILT
jgi:hypothetical protein